MSLFADYVKFCAKVEGQGLTLTFDTHLGSFTYLADCKYKIKVHRLPKFHRLPNSFQNFPIQKHM